MEQQIRVSLSLKSIKIKQNTSETKNKAKHKIEGLFREEYKVLITLINDKEQNRWMN